MPHPHLDKIRYKIEARPFVTYVFRTRGALLASGVLVERLTGLENGGRKNRGVYVLLSLSRLHPELTSRGVVRLGTWRTYRSARRMSAGRFFF